MSLPIQSAPILPPASPKPLGPAGALTGGIDAAVLRLGSAASPQSALLGAIDQLAPRLSPVAQGDLARLRDEVAAAGPDRAAPGDDGDSDFFGFDPVGSLKEVWEKLKDILTPPGIDAPLGIDRLLGIDAAQLAAKSPSLTADLKALEADGWKIVYGPAGDGSFCDKDAKTITIDGSEKGDATALVQTLAHEVGHARHSYTPDYSTSSAYLAGTLGDEGAATLSNIRAQREILAAGGADIGIAGNPANHDRYNAAYDKFLKTGNAEAARQEIGTIFARGERTSTTNQTYEQYYLSWYRATFPDRP